MSAAFFSIIGLVVGAALQYFATRFLEDRRHTRELQTAAYTDYLRAVAEMKHRFIQPQAPKERELLSRLTDAKARVCLYGSSTVVARLAHFESLGGIINNTATESAFLAVLGAMRQVSGVTAGELGLVIFGEPAPRSAKVLQPSRDPRPTP